MATYISTSDITDSVLLETALSTLLTAKITASDAAVVDLAERFGVESASIEITPVHYLVKRWAAAWTCRELSMDLIGKNSADIPDLEKYKIKYDIYDKLLSEIEPQINVAVLAGSVSVAQDRAGIQCGTLFRA